MNNKLKANSNKIIFTFWEPKKSIPEYIKLCIETWKKFLPEYEIIILDYNNLENYLNKETIEKILTKKTTLAKQSDCIRVAILYQYGGIWMDADTIITKTDFLKYFNNSNDCVMISGTKTNSSHIAFIYSSKPKNNFLKIWLDEIEKRVKIYKDFKSNRIKDKLLKIVNKSKYDKEKLENWDYFGNAIINPLIENQTKNLKIINRQEISAFLEDLYTNNDSEITPIKLYRNFYFTNLCDEKELKNILEKNQGLILLHNSWTPEKYKNITYKKLCESDITLFKILKGVLK